jgi:hypothetical protein
MARKPQPGPVVIANGIQVNITWGQGTRTYRNVLHGTYSGTRPLPTTLAEALFSGFKTQLTSSGFSGDLHSDMSMTGVSIKDLNSANQPFVFSTSAAQAGTGAGTAIPNQVAIVVTLATGLSGKAYRGRVYLGGLDSGTVLNSDQHTALAGTNAAAFINGVLSVMNSNAIVPSVFGRALQAGETKPPPGSTTGNPLPARSAQMTPITQARIVSQRFDSQRKRLGRE